MVNRIIFKRQSECHIGVGTNAYTYFKFPLGWKRLKWRIPGKLSLKK